MTQTLPRANQREHILDVALELMSEHGSAAMSMRRLANACGVQVAAIYHYFPSKDALLNAVIEERRYTSRLEAPPGLDPTGPAEARLRAVFAMFWEGALEEERVLRLLLGEALRGQTAVHETGTALLEVFRTGVASLLAEHVPELPAPDTVADVFVALVFSGYVQHVFDPAADVDDIAVSLSDALVATVFPTQPVS